MKKKVAILIHKMYGGGAERVAANLSTYLSNEQYEKKVIAYDSSHASYSFGGDIIDLETKVSNSPFGKVINFFKRLYLVRKIKKQNRIDVTISLLSGPNLVNLLSRRKDKIIISVRNFISKSSTGLYGKLYKILIRSLYNKADSIIVVSQAIKNDLVVNFNIREEKIKVIYNFYDIDKIESLATKTIDNEDEKIFDHPTIITAGRLSKQKGHWHLISAFKHVKNKIPGAKLVILGEGNLESYLKKFTSDLNLEDDVHFLGFQDNPFKYISKADIYAFPSLYEGFPNALCEAMACGVPIIATDCESGPREILFPSLSVNHPPIKKLYYADYGVLVPTCDGNMHDANTALTLNEQLLANGIINLLKQENLRESYSLLARKRVNDFNKDTIIPEWDKYTYY